MRRFRATLPRGSDIIIGNHGYRTDRDFVTTVEYRGDAQANRLAMRNIRYQIARDNCVSVGSVSAYYSDLQWEEIEERESCQLHLF